jgi:outer membrane protein TolC
MTRRLRTHVALLTCITTLAAGCRPTQPVYLFDDKDMSHYRGMAYGIEYPDEEGDRIPDVARAKDPLTLSNPEVTEIWDVSLEEAMRTALANSKVLRNLGGLLFTPGLPASNQTIAPTGVLLQTQGQNLNGQSLGTAQTAQTIYNPAMQETNTANGVEAALSQFDAQFNTQMFWQKNNFPQNQVFRQFQPIIFRQDYAQQQAEIGKVTATGTRVFMREHIYYNQNNSAANQYPSAFNNDIETELRHPFLQGAGVEFNRIAGPNSTNGVFAGQGTSGPVLNPNSLPGTFNGVMLARINVDIALADFEAGLRNTVSDVERAYWDLYYNYRNLNAVQAGRDSALQTWRKVHALYIVGAKGGEAEAEAQAREQYFLFRAQVENTLGLLYTAESRLRYMMGLAPTDGRLIRPSDDPTTAFVSFDWNEVLTEGLTRSVELRRQRWVVKQNELKLIASRNYLLPRLDGQALYRWRGFGDQLVNYNGLGYTPPASIGQNAQPGTGSFNTLWGGQYQEWQLGVNMTIPIGFRLAMSGVRNAELVLAQSRAFLQDQELELSHILTNSIRDLDRNYHVSKTTFNRRAAASRQVEAVRAKYDVGAATVDMLLDAQRRLADAEIAYYRALIDYNVAILQVHYRKNSLLEYNGIYLAEGPWPAKAYFDAKRRARERDSASFINYGFTRPNVITRGEMPQEMDRAGQRFPVQGAAAEVGRTGLPPIPEPINDRDGAGGAPSENIGPGATDGDTLPPGGDDLGPGGTGPRSDGDGGWSPAGPRDDDSDGFRLPEAPETSRPSEDEPSGDMSDLSVPEPPEPSEASGGDGEPLKEARLENRESRISKLGVRS